MKQKLERIQWKNYFINSYKAMLNDYLKLYKEVNNEPPIKNETLTKLNEFTKQAIQEEKENYNECEALLNQLDDENYHTVLYLRYFKGLIVEEVADEMFYTTGYIVVLTAKAIKELERIKRRESNGIKSKRFT